MGTANATAVLEIRGVTLVREWRPVLHDVTIHVAPGEIHALLGLNGCGKSSLAYAIMGCVAHRPDTGRIIFDGRDITDLPIHGRARLGLTRAWQEPARFEGLLVGDYLTLARPAITRDELWGALQAVALDPPTYLRRPGSRVLSGGERKRIELEAIYAMRPGLAILDEPDSGIDVRSVGDITRLVRRMADEGITVVLITHRDEMVVVADRVSLMIASAIVATGNPADMRAELARRCRSPCDRLGAELSSSFDHDWKQET